MFEFKAKHTWDIANVLVVLSKFINTECKLALAGGFHPSEVPDYLKPHSDSLPSFIHRGTTWPVQETFLLENAPKALCDLAHFAENFAPPEICDHLNIFCEDTVVLEWHDFGDSIFHCTDTIGNDVASQLAKALECKLSWYNDPTH